MQEIGAASSAANRQTRAKDLSGIVGNGGLKTEDSGDERNTDYMDGADVSRRLLLSESPGEGIFNTLAEASLSQFFRLPEDDLGRDLWWTERHAGSLGALEIAVPFHEHTRRHEVEELRFIRQDVALAVVKTFDSKRAGVPVAGEETRRLVILSKENGRWKVNASENTKSRQTLTADGESCYMPLPSS